MSRSPHFLPNDQRGLSLVAVLAAVAFLGIGAAAVLVMIGQSGEVFRAQQVKGDLDDMRMAIARRVSCSATVTANRAACAAGGFVTLGTSTCEAFAPSSPGRVAFPSARTDASARSYDLRTRCFTVGTDTYALEFQYSPINKAQPAARTWTPLMAVDRLTCVVPNPPADVTLSGWDARNRVIQMRLAGLTRLNPMGDDRNFGQSGAYFITPSNLAQACLGVFEHGNKMENKAPCNGPARVLSLPPGDDYSSCGNNTTGIWDPTLDGNQGNFRIVNSCRYNGNLWMFSRATCRCDAQPPVTCRNLR